MQEQTPHTTGTVPVVDRRPVPQGVIPRRAQTWLMLGLAAGILGIIAITGQPPADSRPIDTPASAAATPNPSRLRDYQDRLRLLDERARLEALQSSSTSAPAPPQTTGAENGPQADPLADEQRRRDYESRFARVTILARNPGRHVPPFAHATTSDSPSGSPGASQSPTTMAAPSLDAVAEAVIRASTRQAAPAPLDAKSSAPSTAHRQDGDGVRPATTGDVPTHRLPEGTLIEAVLWNKLNLAGESPVICRVTTPLYSRDMRDVLIPVDALILGETKTAGGGDDPLLAIAFHQLRMPNDIEYRLKQVSALSREGDAGLHDKLNRHYPTIFGAAGAIGLISGLAQAIGSRTASPAGDRTLIITGSAADASTQAATQSLNHFLNRRPTGSIRRGHRVLVHLTQDLELPAYSKSAAANGPSR